MSRLRIRTLTFGVAPSGTEDFRVFDQAIATVKSIGEHFAGQGYEVQTIRITTTPLASYFDWARQPDDVTSLIELDRRFTVEGLLFSVGPVDPFAGGSDSFSGWASRLIAATESTSFSVDVGADDPTGRIAMAAAAAILEVSSANAEGNFRFAAAAGIPAETPFFPVAYSASGNSLSIGVEYPNVLREAIREVRDPANIPRRLTSAVEEILTPIAELGHSEAKRTGASFAGVDLTPAPGLDCSIAAVIEEISQKPFGDPATLAACEQITSVLRSSELPRCGYSGLMLPILEDTVLAQRAREKRYTVRELLLYSSVCGAGLDLIPLPGDTTVDVLGGLIRDVAALSNRLKKPLSARLLPIPDLKPGDEVSFENQYLADAVVMPLNGAA